MQVSKMFDAWFSIAKEWICASNQLPRQERTDSIREAVLTGRLSDGRGYWRSPTTISVDFEPRRGAAPTQIAEAFRRASHHEPLPLQWQLLVSAHTYRLHQDLRRSVIDAATGAEIALAEAIRDRFSLAEIPPRQSKAVIKQSNGLMGLAQIVSADDGMKLGVSLTALREKVATPRNRAVHSGKEPDGVNIAIEAIRCARTLLEALHPLDFPKRDDPDS